MDNYNQTSKIGVLDRSAARPGENAGKKSKGGKDIGDNISIKTTKTGNTVLKEVN